MATYTGADKATAYLFDMVSNIAEDYDSASTYSVDAYVVYSGKLYKCTSAILIPETFNPAHWQAVEVMNEITSGGGGGGTTVIANPAGSATDTLNKLQVAQTIYNIPSGGGGAVTVYHADWTATSATSFNDALTQEIQIPAGKYIIIAHSPNGNQTDLVYGLLVDNTNVDGAYRQSYVQFGEVIAYLEIAQTSTIKLSMGQSKSVSWDSRYLTRGGLDAIKIG